MKIFRPSLIALLLISGSAAWADDVKLYDRAPSVEELQRQLTGGAPEAKKKVRTRAIVFGDSPAPAAEQQAAAAPAPTTYQQPAAAQYQPAAPAGGQGTMQVGERAIAFPINFRVNSADIMPESIPFIESIAGLLQKDSGVKLLIEGHTDSSGNPTRNMSLSRERAFSVMNYLIDRYRVDPMRLVPVGKGFSEPLGGTEPTNPKNRRVQFRVLG
jgi:outer membrane protein OmpA-like peptidoglycan-associated protein